MNAHSEQWERETIELYNFNELSEEVKEKVLETLYIIKAAENLGMNLDQNSGYKYLWFEDFCLYMPISCEISDIWVLYSCPIDGEEIEETL